MLAALAAFSVAGLCTGAAFLASYIEENGFPELPTFRRAALAPVPVAAAPTPIWCERTRRWRHPVTRAFVKAPNHTGSQVTWLRGNDQDREIETADALLPEQEGESLPEAAILPWRGRGNVLAAAGVAILDLFDRERA